MMIKNIIVYRNLQEQKFQGDWMLDVIVQNV